MILRGATIIITYRQSKTTFVGHIITVYGLCIVLGACTDATENNTTQCNGQYFGDVCVEIPESEMLGKPCKAHVDCANQAACIEGVCTHQCEEPNDWQCGPGKVCFKWQCFDPEDINKNPPDTPDTTPDKELSGPGNVCTSNMDCEGKAACIDGQCLVECHNDSDCGDPSDWDCKQFQCYSTAPPDVSQPDTKQPEADVPAGDTKTPPEDTQELPPNCTEKKGPYGTTCYCKADCLSGLCIGDIAAGKGFCTDECFTSDNCPGTDWCYATPEPEKTKVCLKNDAGNQCNQGCLSSLTLTNLKGECICTVPCNSASQCPGTMACSLISLSNTQKFKACVPIGDLCVFSDPQSPCFGSCYPDLQDVFFCTSTCTSFTDCPTGFKCVPEQWGGNSFQNCLPN